MKIIVNPKASEWILKQPWLSQFVNNCIAAGDSPTEILSYLLGVGSTDIINFGFIWVKTPEGRDFWSNIDDEIKKVCEKEDWDEFDTTIEI